MYTMAELAELRWDANDACRAAFQRQSSMKGEVDWRELRCSETRAYVNDANRRGFEVLIEGAEPSTLDLQFFISGYLRQRRWGAIEIRFRPYAGRR